MSETLYELAHRLTTGYDPERQEKWDRRYLKLAQEVSTWSKDPSTQVGAVLVNYELGLEFLGYNGFPPGVEDSEERWNTREIKYEFVTHAEVNCILKAGHYARGATLYVYPSFMMPPICAGCAKVALAKPTKIAAIVGYKPDMTDERVKRWANSIGHSRKMFEEAGVTWREITPE